MLNTYLNNLDLFDKFILYFKEQANPLFIRLSQRELACAQLLMQGKTMRETAELLFLSPRTVETHVNHLKDKLHCHSKSALINKLLALNINDWHFKSE